MSTTRIQLALNVEDIAEATAFYSALFGVAPHKQREGYANFAVEDPPLKLVLFENPGAGERLNHLGVEAPTAAAGDRGAGPVPGRRAGNPGRRAGRVLPRRAGQGVRHRPGRAAGLVGVLHRHRRQPGQPGRGVDLGVAELHGCAAEGHRSRGHAAVA